MITLSALGGLSLERDGEVLEEFHEQRRALALLAVLAVGRRTGVQRDRVCLLFWPESDISHAGGALRQLLYTLRRSLGPPPPVLGRSTLRLNPQSLDSDVGRFLEALTENRYEDAVGLYGGPFLDGFHLSRCREFERWLDERRSLLHERYIEALERVARTAGEHGDERNACRWWRRLSQADPLNARVRIELMRSLVSAGDPAGAIREARSFAHMLDEELGVGMPEEVADLVARIERSFPRPPHLEHPSLSRARHRHGPERG